MASVSEGDVLFGVRGTEHNFGNRHGIEQDSDACSQKGINSPQ